jgi:hypothetical protein
MTASFVIDSGCQTSYVLDFFLPGDNVVKVGSKHEGLVLFNPFNDNG